MKTKNKFTLALALLLSTISMAQQANVRNIMQKVDENMSARTRIMTMQMEIETARGTRTIESRSWSEGDNKAFTEYLAPARERGTKMLKLDKQLWIFSPSTNRTVQISGHMLRQSVMGSDMSYEDMMNDTPLLEQYNASIESEETKNNRKCWVIILTAKTESSAYHTQKLWVDQERFVALQTDLYSKSGKLLKSIKFDNVQRIQNRWFPTTMHYKDMLKDGKGTTIRITDIQFNATIPASTFNKANLR